MISERISDDIPLPNDNFEYGYPHSNALLQVLFELERDKPCKAAYHPSKCDVVNDVKQFLTVYDSISQDILSQMFDVIQSDFALEKQVR